MNLQEQWIAWYPIGKESDHYEKISFLDCNKEGIILTCINLRDNKKMMKMFFNGTFVSYRNTNETYMYEAQSACASKASFAYKVLNSQYIKWVSKVSGTLSDHLYPDLQHFVFVSSDDYLEIVTNKDPDIELIELP